MQKPMPAPVEEADLEQSPDAAEGGEFAPADGPSDPNLPAANHVTPTQVPFRTFP